MCKNIFCIGIVLVVVAVGMWFLESLELHEMHATKNSTDQLDASAATDLSIISICSFFVFVAMLCVTIYYAATSVGNVIFGQCIRYY